jgi:hypothetical protein
MVNPNVFQVPDEDAFAVSMVKITNFGVNKAGLATIMV